MSDFSLDLNEDQLQIQKWVHDFAEDVVRPGGPRVGRARGDPVADHRGGRQDRPLLAGVLRQRVRRPDRPHAARSPWRSCSGATPASALAIVGTALAVAGIVGNGTPEQIVEWVPQCFGTPDKMQLGAFCVSEPDAGSDVGSLRTRAVYDEAKDEWVLNGTKTWITNGGIADVHVVVAVGRPRARAAGQASFVVPPGTPGLTQGQKFKKHGIRACHTAEVVLDDVRVPGRCLLGGKEKLDERLARAREAGHTAPKQRGDGHVRGDPPGRRRAGGRHRPRRVRVRARLRQGARAVRPADHREPGDRLQARRHEDGDRRRPAARVARGVDGAPPASRSSTARARCRKLKAGETAVRVTEQAIQILGGYGYIREYPVERWHRDAEDLHDLRGHLRDPAPRHRPQHLRPAHQVALPGNILGSAVDSSWGRILFGVAGPPA